MGSISLRRGTPDDAEILFAIHRETAMTAYAHVFPPDRYAFPDEEMRAHWVSALADPETEIVVAERESTPIGFVGVSAGWLRNLFVLPSEWGRGAGSALHNEAVALLRAAGEGARLWVLEENERARRFYEQRGWRYDGERRLSDFPPYPPALRYSLELEAEA